MKFRIFYTFTIFFFVSSITQSLEKSEERLYPNSIFIRLNTKLQPSEINTKLYRTVKDIKRIVKLNFPGKGDLVLFVQIAHMFVEVTDDITSRDLFFLTKILGKTNRMNTPYYMFRQTVLEK